MKRPSLFAPFLGALLALTLTVAALSASIWFYGTNPRLMAEMMRRTAPSASTALPESEYEPVASMITAYLRGEQAEFQHTFTVDGVTYLAFNSREQAHMADCQRLFQLDQTVMYVSALLLVVLLLWGIAKHNRWTGIGFLLISRLVLAALLVAVGAAIIDFDRLFVLFHQTFFDNELWLLNPQTDLLIRLMPTDFFIRYALVIGGTFLGFMLLGQGIAAALSKRRVSHEK